MNLCRRTMGVVLVGAALWSGFTWPDTSSEKSSHPSKKSKKNVSVPSTDDKKIPVAAEDHPGEISAPNSPTAPVFKQVNASLPVMQVIPKAVPASPPIAQPVQDLASIQRQIDNILWVNQSLKKNYGQQAAEVRRISDQAITHERILKNLEIQRNLQQVRELKPVLSNPAKISSGIQAGPDNQPPSAASE